MPKGLGLWPMAASRRRVRYGPFNPAKVLARMKALGFWDTGKDKPDYSKLRRAFIETNGWDNERDVRTLSNWASGSTEPGGTDLGYLAGALKCRPEDLLEEV